jgi:hypothetical protein
MAKKKSSSAAKSKAKAPKAKAPKADGRRSWLDDDSGEPMIHTYTERLKTFLDAMADGEIDGHEIEAQEGRLVELLRKVESKLDDELHHDVTELLCELTAYNIMHTVSGIAEATPKTQFQG